jgi:DNA ligase (NAD+)
MRETLGDNAHVGQKVEVYKANMIIPQIYSADKSVPEDLSGEFEIPKVCPICGGSVEVAADLESESLECVNPACEGKLINQLDHFCGKKGLEIKGLSVATLQRLVDWGWVNEPADIYKLRSRADEWSKKSGFGAKSVGNIIAAIEDSKNCDLSDFICAIGIPLIGKSASQEIIKHIHSYEDFRDKIKNKFDFTQIPSFADSKSSAILNFDYSKADKVYPYLSCELVEPSGEEKTLEGKTIVITGRLVKCKNRAELEQKIKDRGGKVSSSVSGATTVLINNDTTSTSSKNLTAKKLNVPIMSEEDFFKKYLTK